MDELAAPPVEEFERECWDFLEARYPRRRQERKRFAWGEGSDRVAVFEEAGREAEKVVIANVRAWRRALWDNGLGWITGPAELGGRGLRKGYQQVFDTIVRDYEVPGNAPLTVSLGMIAPTIQAHAVPEVRDRYVPALHNGDLIACQLFSEPGAGSDLAGGDDHAAQRAQCHRRRRVRWLRSARHRAVQGHGAPLRPRKRSGDAAEARHALHEPAHRKDDATARRGQARCRPGSRARGVAWKARTRPELPAHLRSRRLDPRLLADDGEWGTYAWTNVVLGVPGYRIGGGTDEVLRNILGERVLGLPREPEVPR